MQDVQHLVGGPVLAVPPVVFLKRVIFVVILQEITAGDNKTELAEECERAEECGGSDAAQVT